jgi:hypothetical protein
LLHAEYQGERSGAAVGGPAEDLSWADGPTDVGAPLQRETGDGNDTRAASSFPQRASTIHVAINQRNVGTNEKTVSFLLESSRVDARMPALFTSTFLAPRDHP